MTHVGSSRRIQKQIDQTIAKLEKEQTQGNEDGDKIKSKGGGPVEVLVKQKVAWPHEHILRGQKRQHLTHSQITLTQFVQGFVKNVLDENDFEIIECMLQYLGDLMDDTTDISWQSAKANHALLLCEME